jgi:hypothetical protein
MLLKNIFHTGSREHTVRTAIYYPQSAKDNVVGIQLFFSKDTQFKTGQIPFWSVVKLFKIKPDSLAAQPIFALQIKKN